MGVDIRCMMIDTEYFDKVGSFGVEFPATMSGVDYCLKVVYSTGKLISYAADTVAKSNRTIKPEQYDRADIDSFISVWGKRIKQGDPFYNRNLTLNRTDYSLVSAANIRRKR